MANEEKRNYATNLTFENLYCNATEYVFKSALKLAYYKKSNFDGWRASITISPAYEEEQSKNGTKLVFNRDSDVSKLFTLNVGEAKLLLDSIKYLNNARKENKYTNVSIVHDGSKVTSVLTLGTDYDGYDTYLLIADNNQDSKNPYLLFNLEGSRIYVGSDIDPEGVTYKSAVSGKSLFAYGSDLAVFISFLEGLIELSKKPVINTSSNDNNSSSSYNSPKNNKKPLLTKRSTQPSTKIDDDDTIQDAATALFDDEDDLDINDNKESF